MNEPQEILGEIIRLRDAVRRLREGIGEPADDQAKAVEQALFDAEYYLDRALNRIDPNLVS